MKYRKRGYVSIETVVVTLFEINLDILQKKKSVANLEGSLWADSIILKNVKL